MLQKNYQPLTLPTLSWEKKSLTENYAELVAQPLEPGFGITLGNAMRRAILSSVEGAAVTSITIDGVNNEFSSVDGVVEDVLQIVLNIKQIIIKNKTGLPGKMVLDFVGKGCVKVKDIKPDAHLELVNKDQVIANLSEKSSLKITFFVDNGRGYVPAQWPTDVSLQPDGRIYLDAMFSPIKNVAFEVSKTRVGQDMDYDKLVMNVETDGTVSPSEVISYAASVLRSQLELFLTCEEIPFGEISKIGADVELEAGTEVVTGGPTQGVSVDLFLKSIDDLELSVRAHNCLVSSGVKRVIDLVNMSDEDILKIKNFGRKSLKEVKEVLNAFGLRFGMNVRELDLKKAIKKKTEKLV
jgi:DNA-directed RNA polymerase subunit alpha